jgi:hypothetical protein
MGDSSESPNFRGGYMLAKFDENSYIDIDVVSFVNGDYSKTDEKKWSTEIVVGGQGFSIAGRPGRNIMDSFLWKHRNSIYDMISGSETYKKTIK